MYLPHESQPDRVTLSHGFHSQEVESIGGRLMLRSAAKEIVAVAFFDGEATVERDNIERARLLAVKALDCLDTNDVDLREYWPQCMELIRGITDSLVRLNWWSEIGPLCQKCGVDEAVFNEPPKDVLELLSDNNENIPFNLINFGELPFDDDEVASAADIFAQAMQGVDLTCHGHEKCSVLVVRSERVFIATAGTVVLMDEDIVKRYGKFDDETKAEFFKFFREAFFNIKSDEDLSMAPLPEVSTRLTAYDGPWGLRALSEIKFEVVDRSV